MVSQYFSFEVNKKINKINFFDAINDSSGLLASQFLYLHTTSFLAFVMLFAVV